PVAKPTRSRDLLAAIRAAIERDRASQRARREVDALRERYARLTAREREVMGLVIAGRLNKQIARELATTERTIKFHRSHILQKMEADSVAELRPDGRTARPRAGGVTSPPCPKGQGLHLSQEAAGTAGRAPLRSPHDGIRQR